MKEPAQNESIGIVVSPSQIQYILITPHNSLRMNGFFKAVYYNLKSFPKDLLQLKNALRYFEFQTQNVLRRGLNLYDLPNIIFNGSDQENFDLLQEYSGYFNKDIVKVFFIDSTCDNHPEIANLIRRYEFGYYALIGDPGDENRNLYDSSKSFAGAFQLIDHILKDLPGIDALIKQEYDFEIGSFNFAVDDHAPTLNPIYPTMYADNNYFFLNQILANYWLERPEHRFSQEPLPPQERVETVLKQVEVIDRLHLHALQDGEPVTPIEPEFPTLIITAPFHFPKYSKILSVAFNTKKEKMLFRASQTEQLLDYSWNVEGSIGAYLKPEQIAQVLAITTEKLIMLDTIAYLHAQLSNSPVFRLPMAGKSLNMDLSHFQNDFSVKKNVIKKIDKLGELMRKNMVADSLRDYIAQRNGQLVFISDLPMEWLKLNKYPISLTHDVCRIPQFNDNSALNNYIQNQRLNFRIRENVLQRTLIIHCFDDNDIHMMAMYTMFQEFRQELGFISIKCSTREEIRDAVHKYKPDLLIFDCHGDYDEKELSSYLVIDGAKKEYLTGYDIIEDRISAPLVFISACSTMPNYGYVKFLSDAFFQAGAFVVTATFLPIDMIDAAALIIRMLKGLQQQDKATIFSNWLAFISHTLRTVLVHEAVRKERLKKNLPLEGGHQEISEILLEMMVFENREQALESLKSFLLEINPAIGTLFENLDHEWLSYTTMGRADLIYFQSWVDKHITEFSKEI